LDATYGANIVINVKTE